MLWHSSEKPVSFQRATRRYIPEDRIINIHRRDKHKSDMGLVYMAINGKMITN
jgi:hypothetical protein